jgi:hypothetical protein
MDNILIFANTKEELERITKLVLEKWQEHNLFLKAKKCEFCQTRIEFVGPREASLSIDPLMPGNLSSQFVTLGDGTWSCVP